ncbi:MAG: hypothetical protein AB7L91_03655 [Dehalococcoidia bacterium]
MNVHEHVPVRELYREYREGRLTFDALMEITDRRLAEFDARYPMPTDERGRVLR